jgi:CcmD family protein
VSVYLVVAYAVFWICTFVFVLTLWARQRRIARDIEALEARIEDAAPRSDKPE